MKCQRNDGDVPDIAEGANIYDALNALRDGKEQPLGWYLQDAAASAIRLANLLDPPDHVGLNLIFGSSGEPTSTQETDAQERGEWVGGPAQIEEAIAARCAKPLGWFLRDLAGLLNRLSPAFNSPKETRDWQLQFIRRGRGRRSHKTHQMLADANLRHRLEMAKLRGEKQEAVIEEITKKQGVSRAKIFRIKARAKNR